MSNSPTIKPSVFERLWHSRPVRSTLILGTLAAMMLPGAAQASTSSLNSGGWGRLGGNMASTFCGFLESPIVTVVVAVGALALFIVASLGEDNGTMSKLLKLCCFGMAMLSIPGILKVLGFGAIC